MFYLALCLEIGDKPAVDLKFLVQIFLHSCFAYVMGKAPAQPKAEPGPCLPILVNYE